MTELHFMQKGENRQEKTIIHRRRSDVDRWIKKIYIIYHFIGSKFCQSPVNSHRVFSGFCISHSAAIARPPSRAAHHWLSPRLPECSTLRLADQIKKRRGLLGKCVSLSVCQSSDRTLWRIKPLSTTNTLIFFLVSGVSLTDGFPRARESQLVSVIPGYSRWLCDDDRGGAAVRQPLLCR